MVFVGTMRAVALQSAKLQMRIPSIKFRKGGLTTGHATSGSSAAPQVKGKEVIKQAKGGSAQTIVLQELPARFNRKPISQEEIDYINGGGVA